MTSAGQLGILHGQNDGMPAFRWFERDRQKLMVSSKPADAAEMVRRAIERRGPPVERRRQHLQPRDRRRDAVLRHDGRAGQGLRWARRQPGVLRLLLQPDRLPAVVHALPRRDAHGAVPEPAQPAARRRSAARSRPEVRRDARREQRPPAGHERLARSSRRCIAGRTSSTSTSPTTTRSPITPGPERLEALDSLDGIDDAFATIAKAAEDAPRPYRFVVLSDHGQSLGATFKQRYGKSLGDLVRR